MLCKFASILAAAKRAVPQPSSNHVLSTKRVKGSKVAVSASIMDALDCFHQQTLLTLSQDGYCPPDSFNDPIMVQRSSSVGRLTNGLAEYQLYATKMTLPKEKKEPEETLSIDEKANAVVIANTVASINAITAVNEVAMENTADRINAIDTANTITRLSTIATANTVAIENTITVANSFPTTTAVAMANANAIVSSCAATETNADTDATKGEDNASKMAKLEELVGKFN